jgi:hypothetical protein
MPTLVHITDEKNSAAILRSGIRLPRETRAVYFMPVTQSHFVSHQWIRELRRRGAKVLVGVYFRLPSSELVWAGRFNVPHQLITLGAAIKEMQSLEDPLGYEVFVNRAVLASEIQKIRAVSQTVGWRYMPHAHGRELCGCPSCLPRGSIKSRRLRERLEPDVVRPSLNDVKARLLDESDADEIIELLWALRDKRRRSDPVFLEPLMASESKPVLEEIALTLPFFWHARSAQLLEVLANDEDTNVATFAREGLTEILKRRGLQLEA